ncbi:MAG: ComEC/Rec2 family competence protein [Cardiobacteriaceae bacterium]|nr:ComEC/Rec2 family competence protein [Cardiobacteriaceae bacterium]
MFARIFSLPPIYHATAVILLGVWLAGFLPLRFALPLALLALPLWLWARVRLFALCLLLLAFAAWRLAPPEVDAKVCTVTAMVADFPVEMLPRGQRVPLAIDASRDCPSLAGAEMTLFDYGQRDLPLTSRWQMRLAPRVGDDGLLATLQAATPLPPEAFSLAQWRAALDARIRERFPPAQARWLQALLIGNRTALDVRDRTLLRDTGTTHLLAISGLHVGLIALMAYWAGKSLISLHHRWALAVSPRSFGMLFMLVVALLYVLLSGAQAPAWRAWWMLLGISLAWFTPRVRGGMEGLALAAAVSLLLDPAMLRAPSAWLSYLATVAALLAWRRYHHTPPVWQWPLLQGWLTLAITPLIWAWFGGVSLVGYVANLIVIPWLGALLFAGLLALASTAFVPLAQTLLEHTLATLRVLGDIPAAYLEPVWQPTAVVALVFYALILALLARASWRMHLVFVLALAAAVLWPFAPRTVLYQSANGNAAILHTPQGSVVINPGYRYRERDDARRHLLPELRHRARAPLLILITADRKRQHSALKTLLDAYPATPVVSLVPLRDYPFAHERCTSRTPLPPPWQWQGCALARPGWRIDKDGIRKLPDE